MVVCVWSLWDMLCKGGENWWVVKVSARREKSRGVWNLAERAKRGSRHYAQREREIHIIRLIEHYGHVLVREKSERIREGKRIRLRAFVNAAKRHKFADIGTLIPKCLRAGRGRGVSLPDILWPFRGLRRYFAEISGQGRVWSDFFCKL